MCVVVFSCRYVGEKPIDLFVFDKGMVYFCQYKKKAADAFLVERPYGMRVDYSKRGYVLFNRNLNVLGNGEHARLEELPLEDFDVDEIPLEGEIIKEHAGFTDVFFYSDCTNPYAGYVLDLRKLKAYNQFIYPLAMILNRKL